MGPDMAAALAIRLLYRLLTAKANQVKVDGFSPSSIMGLSAHSGGFSNGNPAMNRWRMAVKTTGQAGGLENAVE